MTRTQLAQSMTSMAAGVLVLLGVWCLGRAVETALDRNPQRHGQRETITAALLLGGPATVTGGWLAWQARQQRRQAEARRLRAVFFRLVQTGQGQITPLRFAMEADLDGEQARAYLQARSLEYDATFQVDADGHVTYCFPIGKVDRG